MAYEPALTAVSDPTRRQIIDRIRPGPLSVSEIAEPLPVSRPAVSQHLKVLKAAGLVTVERHGTKNLYALAPSGLDTLREWLEALWEDSLESIARAATQAADDDAIPPVTKAIHVNLDPSDAYHLFLEDLSLWWPVASHSISAADGALPLAVIVEKWTGGRILETTNTGAESVWGVITRNLPPHSIDIDWHVGRTRAEATQVTLRIDPAGRGSKVTLIHSGWDILGEDARATRQEYEKGWNHVFVDRFGAAASAALSNFSTNL